MGLSLLMLGCGIDPKAGMKDTKEKSEYSGYEVAAVDSYDSMDIAIVESIDLEEKTITLVNTNVSKTYTLSYDGTTCFYDKNMQSLSAVQIQTGDVVEVTFYKAKKRLNTLQIYKNAWVMDNVSTFQVAESGKVIEIYGEKYRFTDNSIVVMPYGIAELMDLNQTDTITVTGIDHDICSITVTKGHGYLRLSNDTAVIGGWIEVGNNIIKPITEDMLLLIKEGEYQVTVSLGNASLSKKVSIKRDQETVFDCSSFEPEEILYGNLLFTVDPENTNIYIDGTKVDISGPVELSYGIHQMIARANGYETLSKYIKVGSENASLAVILEEIVSEEKTDSEAKVEETTESSESGETVETGESGETGEAKEPENSDDKQEQPEKDNSQENKPDQPKDPAITDTTASTTYRVYIDAPSDVEVYLDGAYVGLSPVNFKKNAGTHTITLRKSGYVTRSYTVSIDEEEKDISYSFSELEKSTD